MIFLVVDVALCSQKLNKYSHVTDKFQVKQNPELRVLSSTIKDQMHQNEQLLYIFYLHNYNLITSITWAWVRDFILLRTEHL
jgi:hypothetical protein